MAQERLSKYLKNIIGPTPNPGELESLGYVIIYERRYLEPQPPLLWSYVLEADSNKEGTHELVLTYRRIKSVHVWCALRMASRHIL